MINLVIPMAGRGSRFKNAGYVTPKPFIEFKGATMIEHVCQNVFTEGCELFLIAQNDHLVEFSNVFNKLKAQYKSKIILVDSITEGPACSVLLAEKFWDLDAPLIIANSDQIVRIHIKDFINDAINRNLDGSIITFHSNHSKWSYAKINDEGFVIETREKVPISTHATVGIYYFKTARFFIESAKQMIKANDRVNHEFYVAPVYNYLLVTKPRIGIYEIDYDKMYGTGTPEDLENYLRRN